ncbi:MAG: AAA family ATPase, partial [Candidatus Woesearchaeota archaeon]|nr:AAA family ATPase [Candidatus Woesearchaeota archaeon]
MSNQINKQDIETFLNYLNHQTFWIHIFGAGKPNSSIKPQLYSKFHKDKNEIIEICKKYSNALTCVAINPRDENKTKINDIRRLDSLVIDIDVRKERRIKHISTNEDHKHAINKAYKIKEYLERNNFKVSLIVDSGNGSQVYLKLNQDFQTNFKNTNLYQQIINLENQLKSKFNDEIIEIDNITKDINRRIKIPGTINIKHEDQTEDRLSKILYFNKDYNQTTKQNQTSLNSYSSSPCEKKENKALSNNEILDKFQSLIKSHQYFNDLYNDKLTKTKFNNDRSRAEFTFLIWLVDYFQNFKEVNIIMNFCKIGRWKESNSNTKLLNFENAVKRLEYNKEQRQEETLNLWTPNDFKNLKKDDNFLIENVIYPKTITMLYSPPGEFKSIISVQMAINVAQGNTWMNFETQKNAVLYCDK